MFTRLFGTVALLLATSTLAACGGYRVLSRTETGGTVALEGAADTARDAAETYMGAQCPFGYEVLPDLAPSAEREVRISYRCKTPSGQPLAAAHSVVVTF
jgi:hypothetical protein